MKVRTVDETINLFEDYIKNIGAFSEVNNLNDGQKDAENKMDLLELLCIARSAYLNIPFTLLCNGNKTEAEACSTVLYLTTICLSDDLNNEIERDNNELKEIAEDILLNIKNAKEILESEDK